MLLLGFLLNPKGLLVSLRTIQSNDIGYSFFSSKPTPMFFQRIDSLKLALMEDNAGMATIAYYQLTVSPLE